MTKPHAKYKNIDDNSKISGIGSLFRGFDRKQWSINLDFAEKEANSINFSAVPILARRRILNSTSQYNIGGKQFKFTVLNAQDWQVAKLEDCPAYQNAPRGSDANQYCFVASMYGKKIFIPQLEMARVLFYHDPFMARLSLQHNALAEDFYVELNGEMPEIYVRDGAEYPLSYFNRDDNRRFLSWVLMDTHARPSFESISVNLFTNQIRSRSYDHWNFQFNPPPLTEVILEATGWEDFKSKSIFVWEIRSLNGLSSSVTGEVGIIHPKFERPVGGKPTRGDGMQREPPEEYELDDDELSNTDKATIYLMSETVSISFKNPFITNRISKKEKSISSTTGDGEKAVLGNDLSVNEKEDTGNLPGGAWNNLDDQTDDAHLYMGKFQSFFNMVDVLESEHGCQIQHNKLVKLPKVGKGKKHWLTNNQNPRCLAIVELIHNNQFITLLEIDTSDDAAKLSTMMLKTGVSGWLMKNIDQIKIEIMQKRLGWPTDLFKKELTEHGFSGISHPTSKEPGLLLPDEIKPWAQRFVNWISR